MVSGSLYLFGNIFKNHYEKHFMGIIFKNTSTIFLIATQICDIKKLDMRVKIRGHHPGVTFSNLWLIFNRKWFQFF